MDTAVYERQQKEDAAGTGGVRNVAAFVAELAEQCVAHSDLLAGEVHKLLACLIYCVTDQGSTHLSAVRGSTLHAWPGHTHPVQLQ